MDITTLFLFIVITRHLLDIFLGYRIPGGFTVRWDVRLLHVKTKIAHPKSCGRGETKLPVVLPECVPVPQ